MQNKMMNFTRTQKLFSIIGFYEEFFPSSFLPIGVEIIQVCAGDHGDHDTSGSDEVN